MTKQNKGRTIPTLYYYYNIAQPLLSKHLLLNEFLNDSKFYKRCNIVA